MSISARSRTVLSQVVTLHYRTCEPVGSALISKTPELACSPATVRNIMMRLEAKGYLRQPHTSAGRLPTDLGYRTYVEGIKLGPGSLGSPARAHLEGAVAQAPNAATALQMVADFIHRETRLAAFALPLRHYGFRLGHMHLERLNAQRLLAVWVARGGQTFQSVLSIPEDQITRDMQTRIANYFNTAFRDMNLVQIQRRLRLSAGGGTWDGLWRSATLVTDALLHEAEALDTLSIKGISSVLEMPEFHDAARVRTLCRLLEHQAQVKQLVRHALAAPDEWVMFFIGAEMKDPELEGLAVTLAKFRTRDDWIGCVGTLGPKRMPYLHALQILRHAQECMKPANF